MDQIDVPSLIESNEVFESDFRNKSTADAASTTLGIICFLIGVGGRQSNKRPGALARGLVEAMDLGSVTLPNCERTGPWALDATEMVKTEGSSRICIVPA